jgi:hypothetical protein
MRDTAGRRSRSGRRELPPRSLRIGLIGGGPSPIGLPGHSTVLQRGGLVHCMPGWDWRCHHGPPSHSAPICLRVLVSDSPQTSLVPMGIFVGKKATVSMHTIFASVEIKGVCPRRSGQTGFGCHPSLRHRRVACAVTVWIPIKSLTHSIGGIGFRNLNSWPRIGSGFTKSTQAVLVIPARQADSYGEGF